jgi:predicted 3-demethylubiquinone-9 3-methyltransferase (glyoxalase superfamily)
MPIAKMKIVPHLWFDTQAKAVAEFYVAIFPGSRIHSVRSLAGTPSGNVDVVSFELSGQPFMAISAGPLFQFNEAVSFLVQCADQAEIDHYWAKLGEGGDPAAQQCGWLKDKFGLSWQVVPRAMDEMMAKGTAAQVGRVTQAFLQMKKFNLAALQRAYEGQ